MASSDGTITLETKVDESGISSGLSKIKSGAGALGKTFAVAGAAATAAFAGITKAAVSSYAEYEQLVGGVETLFKDSSDTVMNYASQAYQTAGMSANQYMETVTGFSASLLQSLGGDTAKAAEYGNQAVIDMSDNANKMGTDMQRIQDAYQGFAKQNFTMLDNLKLGYGGTKTEMERLLTDAEKIKKANGEMADYSIDSFADITEAIHVVQENMGITGTTAKEAATTIQGSVGMMKAAWENLMTGMADSNADIDKLMDEFIESVETVFDNLAPVVEKALDNLPQLVNKLGTKLINAIPGLFNSIGPKVISSVVQLVTAIVTTISQNASTIGSTLANMLGTVINAIIALIPQMISAGVQLIGGLIQGIQSQYPVLSTAVMTIGAIFATIKVVEFVQGIVSAFQAVNVVLQAYSAACAASQSVSILLATTMTPLQLAVGVLTGQVSLATAAQVAWNAVMNLNPAILIATAVVGLTAAVVGAVSAYDSYIAKHSDVVIASQAMADAAGQAAERAQQLNNSLTEFSGKTEELLADAEAEAYSNTVLADELYNLASQTELAADQKARMQVIIDDLNNSVAGLNLKWDENTGSLNMSREALQEYINKSYEMAQARAVQEMMVDTLKTQYKAQIEAQESSEGLTKATAELEDVYSQVAWTYRDANGEVVAYAGATREQQNAISELSKGINDYRTALDTSNNTVSECESRMQALRNMAGQTGASFAEIGQGAKSAETDVQGMNSTVGSELPQAFETAKASAETSFSGIQQAAETAFNSVKNGASSAASAAPGLGNDFGEGYANGILAREVDAWAAGFALGMAAKQGTQAAQNSNSPSKEAHKLGVDFDDGYVLGLLSETDEVEDAGATLAGSALKGATDITKKLKEHIKRVLSGLTDDIRTEVQKVTDEWIGKDAAVAWGNLLPSEQEYQNALDELEIVRAGRALQKQYDQAEETHRKAYENAEERYKKAIAKAKDDAARAEAEAELEEARAEADRDWEERKREIYNDEIEKQQEYMEDAHIERLKEAAEKERAIHEARLKDVENLKKGLIQTYDDMAAEVISDIEELQKTQQSFATKLANYGGDIEQQSYYTLGGEQKTYNTLANLNKQARTLEKYRDVLLKVKERGNVPQEFFDNIRSMSVDEGLEYATMLTRLSDKKFERYISDWQHKQDVADEIAKQLYADDVEELGDSIGKKFEEASEEFYDVGKQAEELFEDGFLQNFAGMITGIKESIAGAFSTLLPADFALNVGAIPTPAIAAGTVTPANGAFAAGTSGTTVDTENSKLERTLSKLADILAFNNLSKQTVVLEVDGRELGRTTLTQTQKEQARIGASIITK